uniref:Uncharacterized protein n=1 Tax=Globodera rostochiensis TaxID=31243 RepID=A0A914GXU0_GLORO
MWPLFWDNNCLLFLLIFPLLVIGPDNKVAKWTKFDPADETQLQFPNDYSSEFEEDTQKKAEFGDAYDEKIARLPGFDLWKNGQKIGATELPIVTRQKPFWSTPLGTTRLGSWWQTTPKWQSVAPTSATSISKGSAVSTMPTTTSTASTAPSTPTSTAIFSPILIPQQQQKMHRPEAKESANLSTFAASKSPTRATTTATSSSANEPQAWSRSWSIGPNGKLDLRVWESGRGDRVEQRVLSLEEQRRLLQSHGSERESLLTIIFPMTETPPETTKSSELPRNQSSGRENAGAVLHKDQTPNCNVLDAAKDGRPSRRNDKSCKLAFPGIPADDLCKCTYQATGRDEKGCAVGFIYTCARVN